VPDTQEESKIQHDNTGDNPPVNMSNPSPANGNNSSRSKISRSKEY